MASFMTNTYCLFSILLRVFSITNDDLLETYYGIIFHEVSKAEAVLFKLHTHILSPSKVLIYCVVASLLILCIASLLQNTGMLVEVVYINSPEFLRLAMITKTNTECKISHPRQQT